MPQNYFNRNSPNSLIGQAEDYGQLPQREDYGTLPAQNKYGQFKFGGPLGGNEGILDKAFEVLPFVGDIRALDRAREAAQVKITPDLMGGVDVGIEDPYTAAFETATAMPAVGDVATLFKMGAMSLPGIIALMARKTDDVIGLARGPLRSQAGIIGSTGAKTADLAALTRAQELKASGASADDIYGQTRWWLDHPDGRPRFEIDDSGANLSETFRQDIKDYGVRRQENILPHDELYSRYPDTKEIGVMQTNYADSRNSGGSYVPEDDMITLNLRDTPSGDDVKSINLHELQHAVQGREGMARGGSPDAMQAQYDAARARLNFLESEPEYKYVTGELDKKFAELMDGNAPTMAEYNKLEESAMRGSDVYRQAQEQINILKGMKNKQGYEAYKSLAGESEARLVQDRMNMTMPERLAPGNEFYKKFDVPLEDQIVRMEGGVAQSADSLPMGAVKK